jgi:hypothetical protein
MKPSIYGSFTALFIVAATTQAQVPNTLTITEAGETFTSITADYDGSPVAPLLLTGAADNWTIQLPDTFALSPSAQSILLGEPESSTKVNEIDITQPTFLTWQSDINIAGVAGGAFATSITIPNAGLFTTPLGGVELFNLVLVDKLPANAPESSSTAALVALAALGLFGFSRFGLSRANQY